MHKKHLFRLLSIFFIPAVYAISAFAAEGHVRKAIDPVAGRYLVVFDERFVSRPQIPDVASDLARTHGGKLVHVWSTGGVLGFDITMPAGRAEAMSHDPRIAWVEEEAKIYLSSGSQQTKIDPETCDPMTTVCSESTINRLWHLDRTDQDSTVLNHQYAFNASGSGVYVYVLDYAGVMAWHSEFWPGTTRPQYTAAGRADITRVTNGYDVTHEWVAQYNYTGGDNPCYGLRPYDPNNPTQEPYYPAFNSANWHALSHGTSVASLVNGRRVGIAKDAVVVPLKTVRCVNTNFDDALANTVDALHWILTPLAEGGNPDATRDGNGVVHLQHPSVVVSSWFAAAQCPPGQACTTDPQAGALEAQIDALSAANVSFVASANNQNIDARYTTPARHARCAQLPDSNAQQGRVITVGGSAMSNAPAENPTGGTYDSSQPTLDTRWTCVQSVDNECSSTGVFVLWTLGSNYGPCVAVSAPARNITSARYTEEHDYRSPAAGQLATGTSYAAPIVAGVVARYLQNFPSATPDDVFNTLTTLLSTDAIDPNTNVAGTSTRLVSAFNPTISSQPVSIGVDNNGQAVLSVGTIGAQTFQWYQVNRQVGRFEPKRGWNGSTAISGATSSSLTVQPSASASYWVRITGPCCGISDSNVATAYAVSSPPQSLSATGSGASVSLHWTPPAGADNVIIQRRAAGENDFTDLITADATQTNATDSTAQADKVYLYRAYGIAGSDTSHTATSPYSNRDLAHTFSLTEDPIPSNTPVRATHVTEMRKVVNAFCDLTVPQTAHFYSSTDVLASSLQGLIVHGTEWSNLRSQLNTLRGNTSIGLGSFNFRDPTNAVILSIHLEDLRNAVK